MSRPSTRPTDPATVDAQTLEFAGALDAEAAVARHHLEREDPAEVAEALVRLIVQRTIQRRFGGETQTRARVRQSEDEVRRRIAAMPRERVVGMAAEYHVLTAVVTPYEQLMRLRHRKRGRK
jgi:hypothetical protein